MMTHATSRSEVRIGDVLLPDHLFDGYLLHRAALERGLKVLLLPRQVMLAGADVAVPSQVSFTHGVPESSTLSGVTFAQDRRLRRALFERTHVPKPAGASFSHRSLGRAIAWATEKGFPVTVKEAIGENDGEAIRNVGSAVALDKAFTELRRREAADRAPGSNPRISGYTTTRLTYSVDEDGNELAPLRTRMLVEKEVKGSAIRAFVVGDEVVAVVELDDERTNGVREITATIGPEHADVLVRAAHSIPGIGYATIDAVIVPPRRFFGKPRLLVTELSERPRTHTVRDIAPGSIPERVATALLESEAQNSETVLLPAETRVSYILDVDGLRDPHNSAVKLPGIFATHGVKMTILDVDEVMGRIHAGCSGEIRTIAALNELLMAGNLISDRAAAIEYTKGNTDDESRCGEHGG